jgi:hypothetical protein
VAGCAAVGTGPDECFFGDLIGKRRGDIGSRPRDRLLRGRKHSDLAVYISVLIQEQILSYEPDLFPGDEVRICSPVDR